MRRVLVLASCLAFLPSCVRAGEPTLKETLAANVAGYVAGGVPPVVIAIVGVSSGWSVPVVALFALGGAAYGLLNVAETPRAEQVPPLIRGLSGAVKGVVLFPAMSAYASKQIYSPMMARALHDWRTR